MRGPHFGAATTHRYAQSVKHEIPHDLEMAQAQLVARKAVESYAERFAKFGLKPKWLSDSKVELDFEVKGKKLDGSLTVYEDKLVFDMDVPLLFRIFTGKATEILDSEAREWIARAKAGELDAAE